MQAVIAQNKYGLPYLRMSHSSQGLLHGCKRKFEFQRLYPQPTKKQEYWHTMTGKALHEGYQHFLITSDVEMSVWKMMRSFDLRIPQFTAGEEKKTLEACYATLMALIEHKAGMLDTKVAEINVNGQLVPAVEVPFQINILLDGKPYEVSPGLPVIYVGKIDDVLINFLSGEYYVEDLKTVGSAGFDPEAKFFFDEQAIPYSLVLKTALGQDFRQLTMRYLEAVISLTKPEIIPIELVRTVDMVEDWAKGLLCDLEEIKRHMALDWWPRKPSHCTSWNSKCAYFDVCSSRDRSFLQDYFELGKDVRMGGDEIHPLFILDLDLGMSV